MRSPHAAKRRAEHREHAICRRRGPPFWPRRCSTHPSHPLQAIASEDAVAGQRVDGARRPAAPLVMCLSTVYLPQAARRYAYMHELIRLREGVKSHSLAGFHAKASAPHLGNVGTLSATVRRFRRSDRGFAVFSAHHPTQLLCEDFFV